MDKLQLQEPIQFQDLVQFRIFSNHSTRSKAITLSATGKYYWRIVTIDSHGSNSDSGISSFTVTD